MKKDELNLSRKDFPVVTSLDNLEVGKIYTTFKHNILKSLKYNRGKESGYLPERVAAIKKMIENGTFMFGVVHVLVNLKGRIIDGNNRKVALLECGLPVNFMITAEPKFNVENESEILNNVSEYNAINSAWFGTDAYLSALAFKEPAAFAIYELKQWLENENGIPSEMFTPSRLIALATKYKKGLNGSIQPRRAYCNEETANILKSEEFKTQLNVLVSIIHFVRESNDSITAFDVIRCMMPVVWKHDLSLNVVLSNTKKRGFKKMDNTKMKGIKVRVNEILKLGNV
jgi:hypothetical protein